MKYLLSLAFCCVFLAVSCKETCLECEEEETVMCPSLQPVPAVLAAAIPYADNERVDFLTPVTGDTVRTTASRFDREPMSDGFCDGLLSVTLRTFDPGFPFEASVQNSTFYSTTAPPSTGLFFSFNLPIAGGFASTSFSVPYGANDTPSTPLPNTLRVIGDTTMASTPYQEVFVFTVANAVDDDDVSRFYYSGESGFLRVERVSGPVLVLVE